MLVEEENFAILLVAARVTDTVTGDRLRGSSLQVARGPET